MIQPFLKWAGGKRWLTGAGQLPQPERYARYVEPFLGGGAVFFYLTPAVAMLGDLNADLIQLYRTVRDHPRTLEAAMIAHQAKHCRDHYYAVRAETPAGDVEAAARFLYLNRTCWNGLYRVNLRGEFNVPIGTKSTVVFDTDDFASWSQALKDAAILCSDFEDTIDSTVEGDFLFVDPPYTVQHNANGFLKYNERIFSWSDQVRLVSALQRASSRGVAVVVTNADHSSVRELYRDGFEYRELRRASVLAADSARRGGTTEAMFVANLAAT